MSTQVWMFRETFVATITSEGIENSIDILRIIDLIIIPQELDAHKTCIMYMYEFVWCDNTPIGFLLSSSMSLMLIFNSVRCSISFTDSNVTPWISAASLFTLSNISMKRFTVCSFKWWLPVRWNVTARNKHKPSSSTFLEEFLTRQWFFLLLMIYLGNSKLQQPIGICSRVVAKIVIFVAKANFHFEFGHSRVALSTKSVTANFAMMLLRASPLLKLWAVLKITELSWA